jgi:hypothetical protein
MYYEGEGEDRKPVFEVGDSVRINAQDNEMCGFYGDITVIEQGSLDKMVTIERQGRVAHAFMYQLEAN